MSKTVIGSTLAETYVGSTGHKVFGTDGRLYQPGSTLPVIGLNNEYINYVENITYTTAGVLSASTCPAYGITYVSPAGALPTSDSALLTLAAPIAGVEKTIIFNSSVAGALLLDVYFGSGVTLFGSSGYNYIAFSSLFTDNQAITLIGLTTALWAVKSHYVATSSNWWFGAAGGLRGTTAARSS